MGPRVTRSPADVFGINNEQAEIEARMESARMTETGSLRITRISSTNPAQDNNILITVRLGPRRYIEITMLPDAYGLATTGLSGACVVEQRWPSGPRADRSDTRRERLGA